MTSKLLRSTLWALVGTLSLNLSAQTASIVREASGEFADVKTVKIEGQFCKIDLSASSDNKIVFTGKLISDKHDDAYQLVNEVVDGVLNISIKYPAQGWTTHSGEIVLKIPNGTTLDVVSTSGSLKIDGLTDVTLKAVSRSGNLEASKCEGSLYLETVTGVVKMNDCSGTLSGKTKTGNQFIANVKGVISANSTEGDIAVQQTEGTITTESTSGKQSMDFHQGNINAKSVNGSIKINEVKGDINVISFAGALKLFKTAGVINLQTTAGEQVGTRVLLTGNSSLKSTEGKIKMQIDNKTEEVTFLCKSTEAFIQARGQSKKKSLKLGKGPIVITSESTTGGQVYN